MSYNNQSNFDNDTDFNSGSRRDDGLNRTGDLSTGFNDQPSGRDQFSSGGRDRFDDNNFASGRGTNTGMGAGGNSNFDNDFSMGSNRGGRNMGDTTDTQGYGAGNDFDNTQGRTSGSVRFSDDTDTQGYDTRRHADDFGSTGVDRSGRPGVGDKIKGTAETTLGKVTGNLGMVERGQERKTDTNF